MCDFCGAGICGVGDTLSCHYLCRVGDSKTFEFAPVATTDVVCALSTTCARGPQQCDLSLRAGIAAAQGITYRRGGAGYPGTFSYLKLSLRPR